MRGGRGGVHNGQTACRKVGGGGIFLKMLCNTSPLHIIMGGPRDKSVVQLPSRPHVSYGTGLDSRKRACSSHNTAWTNERLLV